MRLEASVNATDKLLWHIYDRWYVLAPRVGEQRHGQIGVRVFLGRKRCLLVLMKEVLVGR